MNRKHVEIHLQFDRKSIITIIPVAALLGVDEKKLLWSLCNYCVIEKGAAVQRKLSVASAAEALLTLARGLYSRLVDFIVNIINLRLSVTRVVL